MTSLAWVACLVLLPLGQVEGGPAPRGALPLRYVGKADPVDVPLDPRELGWAPQASRIRIYERREMPRASGDDDPADGEAARAIERAVPIHENDRALAAECFDLWICGDLTEEKKMIWLLANLSGKVVAARDRGLSPAEEGKLILAGRGDIKRFLARIEAKRRDFEAVRKDVLEGQMFLKSDEIRSLSAEFRQGPFGDDSLFAKILAKFENDRKPAR